MVELLLAVLILAAVLGPFLAFVSRIPDLNSAIGQQGRSEAWRSSPIKPWWRESIRVRPRLCATG